MSFPDRDRLKSSLSDVVPRGDLLLKLNRLLFNFLIELFASQLLSDLSSVTNSEFVLFFLSLRLPSSASLRCFFELLSSASLAGLLRLPLSASFACFSLDFLDSESLPFFLEAFLSLSLDLSPFFFFF